jgi:AcrR family transcriptional regulator
MPQQERGQRRVAALVSAAESVMAEVGYEAATMSAIAEKARAPIGSLYQFFPNKVAITRALRTWYGKQFQGVLAFLDEDSDALSIKSFVNQLIDSTIVFVESHPAFVPLLDAPSETRSTASIRNMLRERVSQFFMARKRRLSKQKALRLATVTLQILRGLNQLYAEAQPGEKQYLIHEFKVVLFCYLTSQIGPDQGGRPESNKK